MKQFLISVMMICFTQISAQMKIPADLNFTTPFYKAEDQYIVFPPKPEDKDLSLGVPYFDPSAGYSYRYLGNLKFENDKLIYTPSDRNSAITARWQNLELKVAVLSGERVKALNLPLYPEFLAGYQTDMLDRDFLLEKLSAMNGAGYSNLALADLEKLRRENYQSAKFYFELAFAYNALGQFAKAEEAVKEAEQNNFHDELMIKEMHFALLHQDKLVAAADYLEKNFKNFKSKLYKSEGIVNQIISFYNNKDTKSTEKWIKIYKNEIGDDQYKSRVEDITIKLKKNKA